MTGIPDLGIRVDIMGRVLDPLLCVVLADIQSVGIGACMHVCVWYTELTCISNIGERTGLRVRASDSESGDPGSILGRVGVLFP